MLQIQNMAGSTTAFPQTRLPSALVAVVLALTTSADVTADTSGAQRFAAGWIRGFKPPAPPARIVSLAPSVTELLFDLGVGDRVVGVTRFCDRPAAALALPKIGGFADASLEAVIALHPAAVVAVPAEANRKVVDRLVDLGVPVLLLPALSLEDIYTAIHVIGVELGVPDRAVQLEARIREKLRAVAARVARRPAPRTVIIYDHRPLIVAGAGSFPDEVLVLAGGRNVIEGGTVAYPTISLETLARLAPDVVVDASMGARDSADPRITIELLGRFQSIPAVRNNRVVALRPGVLMRPGTSLADDVEELARLLHPAAYAAGTGASGAPPRPASPR